MNILELENYQSKMTRKPEQILKKHVYVEKS
jgi:hypothetical protein